MADYLPHASSLPERSAPIRVIILHTPSVSFSKRAGGTIEGAVARYRKTGHKYYGHEIVDPVGDSARLAPLNKRAWHSASLSALYTSEEWRRWAKPLGADDYLKHGRDPAKVWDWWDARWPGVSSPADLIDTRYPNNHSVGIDIMPTEDGEFTIAAMEAAAVMCRTILSDVGVVASMGGKVPTVLTHSDIDPLRRGAVRKGDRIIGKDWDLGSRFDYAGFGRMLKDGTCA